MEPRRRRRGNQFDGSHMTYPGVYLQWSRGVAAAETADRPVQIGATVLPSMEPRRRRRGNRLPSSAASALVDSPSMEPRRRRRGNLAERRPAEYSMVLLQWSRGV